MLCFLPPLDFLLQLAFPARLELALEQSLDSEDSKPTPTDFYVGKVYVGKVYKVN